MELTNLGVVPTVKEKWKQLFAAAVSGRGAVKARVTETRWCRVRKVKVDIIMC